MAEGEGRAWTIVDERGWECRGVDAGRLNKLGTRNEGRGTYDLRLTCA